MNTETLKQLIRDKGFNINSLSKAIGMTHVGLSKAIENNTISVSVLERISDVFGISPCYFFQQESNKLSEETKYKFLKNEILAKGEIYIDVSSVFDKIRRELVISSDLLSLINKTLTKNEIDKVLKFSGQRIVSGSAKINGDMPHLLAKISEIANERHYDALYYEIVNERGLWNVKIVETAMNDPRIQFLRNEKLIDDSDLLVTIAIYSFDIESSYSFLLEYFEIKDIRRAFKRAK